jgi:hypothetical protein
VRKGWQGGRGNKKPPAALSPQGVSSRAPDSRTKAGKLFGVGEKAVDTAAKIRKGGECGKLAVDVLEGCSFNRRPSTA